jgi:hypothetical protein
MNTKEDFFKEPPSGLFWTGIPEDWVKERLNIDSVYADYFFGYIAHEISKTGTPSESIMGYFSERGLLTEPLILRLYATLVRQSRRLEVEWRSEFKVHFPTTDLPPFSSVDYSIPLVELLNYIDKGNLDGVVQLLQQRRPIDFDGPVGGLELAFYYAGGENQIEIMQYLREPLETLEDELRKDIERRRFRITEIQRCLKSNFTP